MRFIIEPGHGVIRLRLQIGGIDPAFLLRNQPGHAPPIQQVRHQRGDENRLARPRQPGDTQADDRLKKRLGYAVADTFDATHKTVCQC